MFWNLETHIFSPLNKLKLISQVSCLLSPKKHKPSRKVKNVFIEVYELNTGNHKSEWLILNSMDCLIIILRLSILANNLQGVFQEHLLWSFKLNRIFYMFLKCCLWHELCHNIYYDMSEDWKELETLFEQLKYSVHNHQMFT